MSGIGLALLLIYGVLNVVSAIALEARAVRGLGDGGVLIGTSPEEYMLGTTYAQLLLSQNSGRFSFVAAFLACRAIELALKAYLVARGDSLAQVKQLGHDLTKALIEAYARGIDVVVQLDPSERVLLQRVNEDYVGHNFAYFDVWSAVAAPKDPELDKLPSIARRLLDGIEKGCHEASEANWNPIEKSSPEQPNTR